MKGRILSKEVYQAIFYAVPDAIIVVELNGKIIEANQQSEKLFGYTLDELIGQEVEFLIPHRYVGIHRQHWHRYALHSTMREVGSGLELIARRKDGTEIEVEIRLSPIFFPDNKMISASIQDVSERKRMSRQLQDAVVSLESKNEELERFASIASHDLQEPLRTASGILGLLEAEYRDKLDATAGLYIQFLISACDRMKCLVKNLLDYSKVGHHTQPVNVDCMELIKCVLEDIQASVKESGAKIIFDQLPTVVAYETELRQLFQNLLSNAIKYRKPAKSPCINIRAKQEEGYWRFEFEDNGIGIMLENYEKIFMIFQRLHTRQEYEGTGIGLAQCKKIVELHGGRIWVESSYGDGSVFYFTLLHSLDDISQ